MRVPEKFLTQAELDEPEVTSRFAAGRARTACCCRSRY